MPPPLLRLERQGGPALSLHHPPSDAPEIRAPHPCRVFSRLGGPPPRISPPDTLFADTSWNNSPDKSLAADDGTWETRHRSGAHVPHGRRQAIDKTSSRTSSLTSAKWSARVQDSRILPIRAACVPATLPYWDQRLPGCRLDVAALVLWFCLPCTVLSGRW